MSKHKLSAEGWAMFTVLLLAVAVERAGWLLLPPLVWRRGSGGPWLHLSIGPIPTDVNCLRTAHAHASPNGLAVLAACQTRLDFPHSQPPEDAY